MDRLIEALISRQGRTPDGEFARALGLSRPMWQRIRTGQRRLGVRSLALIHARYPALAAELVSYVLSRNSE